MTTFVPGLLLCPCVQVCYALGLSLGIIMILWVRAPARHSDSIMSAVPEPETYLFSWLGQFGETGNSAQPAAAFGAAAPMPRILIA